MRRRGAPIFAPSLSSQIQLRPSAKRCCLPPKSPTFVRALWQIPLKRRVGPNEASALPTCHLFVSRHGLPIATCTPFAASPNRTPSPCLSAHQEEEEAGEMNSKQKSQKKTESHKKKQECQKKTSVSCDKKKRIRKVKCSVKPRTRPCQVCRVNTLNGEAPLEGSRGTKIAVRGDRRRRTW